MKQPLLLAATLTVTGAMFAAGCGSPRQNMTLRDAQGDYITTSDYRAMARTEFFDAMDAGLDDFDARMEQLRKRANQLGGETLEEFAECEDDLAEERRDFENQLTIAENALDKDWPDQREETVDAYVELREALEEAYEDVLED